MLTGGIVWVVVVTLYSAKWLLAREDALAEARHPIQGWFISLGGISTMMLAISAAPYSRIAAEIFFIVGLIFTLGFTVWRTGSLIMGECAYKAITPVLYLPTVAGGFVGANAAKLLDYGSLAEMTFGAAFFCWLSIESMIIYRLVTAGPIELALRPTLVLLLTPPTIGGVAAVNILGDQWSTLPVAMLGYATFQALVLIRLTPWIIGKHFTPDYWGTAFGATAFSMLSLRLAERRELSLIDAVAPWLFLGANFVVAIFIAGSISLLSRRQHFTPQTESTCQRRLL